MRNITQIKTVNLNLVIYNISRFYINAKQMKFNNSYGWEEVVKDIQLARKYNKLVPTDKTTPNWIRAGFNVARNKRGWAFAYTIENDVMYIHDAENCRNLTATQKNTDPFITTPQQEEKQCWPMRYKIYACRLDDGFIYLYNKDGQKFPDYKFNEILKPFYRYKNGEIYAVGLYGGKKFKITLDGVAKLLQEMRLRTIIRQVIVETLHKRRYQYLVS